MNQPTEIRIPDFFRNGIIIWVVVIVALLAGLLTSIYTVQAESRGVVLRFGKYLKTVEPGLRFKLPFGIEKVYVIPVERTLLEEFGFITPGALNPGQSNTRSLRELEKSMITGDLNSAEVEWIVQYRINDPRLYLFEVYDPVGTLRHISESVMRTVVGDRTVDEVITIGREEVEEEAMKRLEIAVQKYELGIGIEQVQLQNVNPPPAVEESFNEVNRAQQEKERMINEAEGDKNKEIPLAEGVAQQKILASEGYALKRVNEALGDVARFNYRFEEFQKAPEVTRTRLYLEAMKKVIPQMGKKIIMDEDASQVLPLLQLQPGSKGALSQ